jgi:uncharacterized protein YjbI with pentapeptide repeats
MRNCKFERSQLDNSSVHAAELVSVSFRESSLDGVIFSGLRGTHLLFVDSKVTHVGFGESQYGTVAFERGESKGITFNSFQAASVEIRNCRSIEALSVIDSSWDRTAIGNCPAISELAFTGMHLKDFSITRSQIAYCELVNTAIVGESHITSSQFAGLSLAGSTLRGVRFSGCTFADYLVLDGATLDGLVASGIVNAAGLRVMAKGVNYLNGSTELRGQ